MIRRRQHIDVFEVSSNRQRTDHLGAVDEDERPHRVRQVPDGRDVGAMARCGLHPAERDQLRATIDVTCDVVGFEATVAERDLADLVALLGEQPPREMVRAVLAFADHHVLSAAGGSELCGHEPRRGRHRRDQRNVGSIGAHQCCDRGPRSFRSCFPADVVETGHRPFVDVAMVRRGQCLARQPDRCRVEVGRRGRGREQRSGISNVDDLARFCGSHLRTVDLAGDRRGQMDAPVVYAARVPDERNALSSAPTACAISSG